MIHFCFEKSDILCTGPGPVSSEFSVLLPPETSIAGDKGGTRFNKSMIYLQILIAGAGGIVPERRQAMLGTRSEWKHGGGKCAIR